MGLCEEWGATDFDRAMEAAAWEGHVEVMKVCEKWGVVNLDRAMEAAALRGRVEVEKLCKEWAIVEMVKLCEELTKGDESGAVNAYTRSRIDAD